MTTAQIGTALRQVQRLFVEGSTANVPDGELLERFLSEGDEAAFTALIERHGPMVLGTCRAMLGDRDGAEDAFQATFLVLICKARSIRGRGALASWLYQVAHRIALQAGTRAARRRSRERQFGQMRAEIAKGHEGADDWRPILHEEVARLSEKYRLPLLLCDLEGKTHAQAAIELNCGEATVQRRLARARELLRSRLVHRGVTLPAGGLAMAFGRSADAAVPPCWVEAIVRAAGTFGARASTIAIGEVVSTTARTLARQSLRSMVLGQLRAAAAAVVFLTAVVGIAWGLGLPGQERERAVETPRMQEPRGKAAAQPAPAGAEKPVDLREIITVRGRVLDPKGHPFQGARLYLINDRLKDFPNLLVRATSDHEGRFLFRVSHSDFEALYSEVPWSFNTILALSEPYAFALGYDQPMIREAAVASPREPRVLVANDRVDPAELTLRLARDDVPISGRIIDLEGRPVAGVLVKVVEVRSPAKGSLNDWLKAVEESKDLHRVDSPVVVNPMLDLPSPPGILPVRTGPDGRFLLKGIGRERIAKLQVEGPTIETVHLDVLTRPGRTIRYPRPRDGRDDEAVTIHGSTFEHVAGPTRPIEGVVSDMDTGRPLAGILVHSERALSNRAEWRVQAITDARGHYRLVGLPRGREGVLMAIPPIDIPWSVLKAAGSSIPRPEELPYLRAQVSVPGSPLNQAAGVDIRLKRGVWVIGRVIDPNSGKPVQASLAYYVYDDNPHLKRVPGFTWSRNGPNHTDKDGLFHLVAFPGQGVLAASVAPGELGQSTYVMGAGLDRFKHKIDRSLPTRPYMVPPMNYQALAEIDPAPGTASLSRDLVLETGRSLKLTVLDPNGKPLTGLRMTGLFDDGDHWPVPPSEGSSYRILGLKPGRQRDLCFLDEKQKLAGELVLHGDETNPQSVTLRPWGTLTGRVVDAEGEPQGTGFLYPRMLPVGKDGRFRRVGKDGRFRVEGLVPGKPYEFVFLLESGGRFARQAVKDVKVGPGEVKDLGDVVPKLRKGQ